MKKILYLLTFTLLLLSFTSCNWDVWGGEFIDYGEGSANANASMFFTGTKPEHIKVTASRFSDEIRISWDRVLGADYYEIFRSEYSESNDIENLSWTRLTDTSVNSTSYTDTNVEDGVVYAYRVRARSFLYRDVLGNYSDTGYGWTLSPPQQVEASQGESTTSITVTWSSVKSVNGYMIYWSDTGYDGTWNPVTTVLPNTATKYQFRPSSAYYGKTLYFYVTAVSSGNNESDGSIRRQGYTHVEGAPEAPSNLTATKGESTDSITLSWTAMSPSDGSYDWEIYRRSGNESETLIYSTVRGDDPPEEENGMMSYVDESNLSAGVVYTYTIMAIGVIENSDGSSQTVNGSPSSAEGYLLSPPTTITEKRINDTNNGFVFTFLSPLGDDGLTDLKYNVYAKVSASDSFSSLPIITEDLDGRESYTIEIPYESGGYEYFDIRVQRGGLESIGYSSIGGDLAVARPVKAKGYSASDNLYLDSMTVQDGQYPVLLQMDMDDNATSYTLRVWKNQPSGVDTTAAFEYEVTPEVDEEGGTYRIEIEKEATPEVGSTYYYAVRGKDRLGREGEWSDIDSGYSAITGAELIKHMQVFCLKPWEYLNTTLLGSELTEKWRGSTIYSLVSQAGMGSLGSAEESGNASGRMTYNASYSPPASGSVSFTYTNFGEKSYMQTNGNYNMNVSLSGSGSCSGGITISGMYPATIGFTNISVSNQKFVGTYTVTQRNGHASEEVSPDQEVR